MHTGKSYKLSEFLFWTRRSIFWALILGIASTTFYQLFDLKWLAIPFTIIGLVGTATVFIITFRNQETYNRTWEARQIWGATISATRSWVMMCRDFVHNMDHAHELIYRQFAWLTALRYQLRAPREPGFTSQSLAMQLRRHRSTLSRLTMPSISQCASSR